MVSSGKKGGKKGWMGRRKGWTLTESDYVPIHLQVVGDSRCPIVDTWWQTETGKSNRERRIYVLTYYVCSALPCDRCLS